MAVEKGVTLEIEPGVTVNLESYYIRVNGTFIAKGTVEDKIYFNSKEGSDACISSSAIVPVGMSIQLQAA